MLRTNSTTSWLDDGPKLGPSLFVAPKYTQFTCTHTHTHLSLHLNHFPEPHIEFIRIHLGMHGEHSRNLHQNELARLAHMRSRGSWNATAHTISAFNRHTFSTCQMKLCAASVNWAIRIIIRLVSDLRLLGEQVEFFLHQLAECSLIRFSLICYAFFYSSYLIMLSILRHRCGNLRPSHSIAWHRTATITLTNQSGQRAKRTTEKCIGWIF